MVLVRKAITRKIPGKIEKKFMQLKISWFIVYPNISDYYNSIIQPSSWMGIIEIFHSKRLTKNMNSELLRGIMTRNSFKNEF